jgi:hypothetical protein
MVIYLSAVLLHQLQIVPITVVLLELLPSQTASAQHVLVLATHSPVETKPTFFSAMTPPIEHSVVRTGQNHWLLGTLYVCELVDTVPNDAVVHWEADGNTYCIRTSTADVHDSPQTGDSESNLCHHAGTSAAVWCIGGVFVKVKAWQDGMQLESDTIRFVNSISSVPTPEIVHSWVDAQCDRSFLVLKALEGTTLDKAWESLSASQHMEIANTVAQYCETLASHTSKSLETANGMLF